MTWLVEALTDAARQERSIWYHGTRGRNISSILSQGLIPDPKTRAWQDDPDASLLSPSRASLGGIYLTRDLMTARISSGRGLKDGETQAIVIVEAQPRSLVADEDYVTHALKEAVVGHEWLVAEAYFARALGTNNGWLRELKNKYIATAMSRVKHKFIQERMHPDLEARVAAMLEAGWDTALDRQAAYAYEGSRYDWNHGFARNMSKKHEEQIDGLSESYQKQGMSEEEANARAWDETVPKRPDKGAAEAKYAAYVDAMTRTLKSLARPKASSDFMHTARSMGPIGFSGSNRIVGIVEYAYDPKKYGDYHDRAKLVYGTIPDDFVIQWERSVGSLILVKDLAAPASLDDSEDKVASSAAMAKTAETTQKQVSDLAKRLIRGAWSKEYFDRGSRYCSEEVILIIENEADLEPLLFSLGEDMVPKIKEEIVSELARMEERVFERRRSKLSGPLDHIKDLIKGKNWNQAKKSLYKLSPGYCGDADRDMSDEMAESLFARLYGTTQQAGYADVEMLRAWSPYEDENGQRYLKRLSEIRRHEEAHGVTDRDIQDYNEDNAFVQLFGYKAEVPTDRIEVYRGVSRADAKLRPGDFVTPNRTYARSYMRGKFGGIIRETVSTDDLLVMKIGDEDRLEFVYYPRSAMGTPRPSSTDVKPPYTFRQFWAEVNGVAP